jgi:elongation factor 1-beta
LNSNIHPFDVRFSYEPTKADVETFSALEVSQAKTPNVLRWYNHIKSFSDKERAQFPDQKSEFIVTAGSSAKPADDEDDVDLFGSDDEEV